MTNKEILKKEKKEYKRLLKNKNKYLVARDNVLEQILGARVPNWGGLKITMLKI